MSSKQLLLKLRAQQAGSLTDAALINQNLAVQAKLKLAQLKFKVNYKVS